MSRKKRDERIKLDPLKTARQAQSFNRAKEILWAQIQSDKVDAVELHPSSCTLAAFSCELFLKCIICIEKGDAPKGHDLLPLYKELKPETRRQLDGLWTQQALHGEQR